MSARLVSDLAYNFCAGVGIAYITLELHRNVRFHQLANMFPEEHAQSHVRGETRQRWTFRYYLEDKQHREICAATVAHPFASMIPEPRQE